jgi:kynurenine formamidase
MTSRAVAVSSILGTACYIDRAAILRGMGAVETGESVGLGRDVIVERAVEVRDAHGAKLDAQGFSRGRFAFSAERMVVDIHGTANTHIDGLNHISVDGCFHSGFEPDDVTKMGVAVWSKEGLVTRAILADITRLRGEPWVTTERPVTAAEVEACLAEANQHVLPGDALLLYMGRDRYEAAGHTYTEFALDQNSRPGAAGDVGDWVVDHRIAMLCWDFLDASNVSPEASVHARLVTHGLLLIDNCAVERAIGPFSRKARPEGLICISPPALHGATGMLVNPLLIV